MARAAKFRIFPTARNRRGPVGSKFLIGASCRHNGLPYRGNSASPRVLLHSTALETPGTRVTCGYNQFSVTVRNTGMICNTRVSVDISFNAGIAKLRGPHG